MSLYWDGESFGYLENVSCLWDLSLNHRIPWKLSPNLSVPFTWCSCLLSSIYCRTGHTILQWPNHIYKGNQKVVFQFSTWCALRTSALLWKLSWILFLICIILLSKFLLFSSHYFSSFDLKLRLFGTIILALCFYSACIHFLDNLCAGIRWSLSVHYSFFSRFMGC